MVSCSPPQRKPERRPFLRPARHPIFDLDTPTVACNKGPDDKKRHTAIGCAGDSSTKAGSL